MASTDEHDHGDEPITLDEVLESIRRRPVRVRIRRTRVISVWTPEFIPPEPSPGPLLPDLDDWLKP
jgi:hypothetical protein